MLPTLSTNIDVNINADSDQINNEKIPVNNTVTNILSNEVYTANLISLILNSAFNIDELTKNVKKIR